MKLKIKKSHVHTGLSWSVLVLVCNIHNDQWRRRSQLGEGGGGCSAPTAPGQLKVRSTIKCSILPFRCRQHVYVNNLGQRSHFGVIC